MNLTKRDWLVVGMIAFYLCNITFTNYIIYHFSTCAGASANAEQVAEVIEANPLQTQVFKSLNYSKIMLLYLIIPGALVALYLLMRWRLLKTHNEDLLNYVVVLMFFMFFVNFANDLGAVLGVLL